MPYFVTENCILCGACESGCDVEAITLGDTQAHIDIHVCIECGTCERNCPTGTIIYVSDEEYKRLLNDVKTNNETKEG